MLVDKNGEPRRIFNNPRSGSLSHMFRRKSTGTHGDENSTENSINVGIFSRIFKQWRTGIEKEEKMVVPEARDSPELDRKLSTTIAAREDARKLKTATLDRMGKMFKIKSNRATDVSNEKTLDSSNDSHEDQQSRKEKTNSLGRMLKLVDKNGEPRRIFNNPRSGSLSHMFRRKSTGTHGDENSTENSSNVGVFSRIFKQWKNRSGSGNATAEPNLCASFTEENKSLSSKPSSSPKLNISSTCTFPSPVHPATTSSVVKSGDIENPA